MTPGDNVWEIKIGPANDDRGVVSVFQVPDELWERWYKIGFQFKVGRSGSYVSQLQVTPSRMIYVRERWYHRLANYIYRKVKKWRSKNSLQ